MKDFKGYHGPNLRLGKKRGFHGVINCAAFVLTAVAIGCAPWSTRVARADDISGTATGGATVQPAGPRTGSSGTNFLNVESNGNGAFASFGVLDFMVSTFTLGFPVVSVSNLNLRLQQSNAAFTLAGGTLNFYLSQDTTTSIANTVTSGTPDSPLRFQAANAPEGLGTQLSPAFLIGSGSFTGVNGTNAVDNYALTLSAGAESYFINQLNSSGTNLIRLIITPSNGAAGPNYAATWVGATNSTVSSRPTLSFSAVLDQPILIWKGGDGIWDNTNTNWRTTGSNAVVWDPARRAIFNTPAGTVTLGEPVTATGLQFNIDGYVITGTNALTLSSGTGGNIVQVVSAADTATISAMISGFSGLVKSGLGALVLTGSNDFQGGITISAGTVAISDDSNLGSDNFQVTLNGGTFRVAVADLMIRAEHSLAGSGTIDTGAGNHVTFNGGSTVTALSVIGSGQVIFPTTATMTVGTLSLAAGSTVISNGIYVGPTLGAFTTVNGDGTFIIAGDQINAGSQGLQTARGTGLVGPNIILTGPKPQRGLGTIDFRFNAGTLSSTSNLTGTNAVLTRVSLGGNAAIGAGGDIEFAGGLELFNTAVKTFSVNNHTTISGPVTVSTSGTTNNRTLLKSGTGTLTLTSAQNVFGDTTVTRGTLEVGPQSLLGNGLVTVTPTATEDVRLVLQTNTAIDDLSNVILTSLSGHYGQIALQFSNSLFETVGALIVDGTSQSPGFYSAAELPNFLTGTGRIQVTTAVPEPSSILCFAAMSLTALGFHAARRRRKC